MAFFRGLWYFLRNIIRIVLLIAAIGLTINMSAEDGVDVAGNIGLAAFLFFLFFATVSTTYDLGGGWFLTVTTGVGIGGAVVGFFIVAIISEAVLTWVATHTAIVIGILLASFVINQIIETIKYFETLPIFFTITGGICVLLYGVEMILAFCQKPSFIFAMDYEGLGGLFQVFLLFVTVILTFINIIARATQAHWVEE